VLGAMLNKNITPTTKQAQNTLLDCDTHYREYLNNSSNLDTQFKKGVITYFEYVEKNADLLGLLRMKCGNTIMQLLMHPDMFEQTISP
jgi:hypothetical protein